MGKRKRNRQREFGMRKMPNESQATFQTRMLAYLSSLPKPWAK